VKKWTVTIIVVLALAALGLTVRIWVPWLLEFAIRNKEKVESLQELAELISQIAAWSAAIVVFVYKLWRRKPPIVPSQAAPTVANSHAARDVNTAGRDVQTGGTHAEHDVVGRDSIGRDNIGTVIYQTAPTAHAPTLNPLHQLPPPPADFTGRTTELAELRAAIEKGGVHISGLQGQGGVGKTALALKLAAELAPKYPDAQIYLDLKGVSEKPLTAAEAMSHVLRTFHPETELPEKEQDLRALYLSVLHEKRVLLLMDNARGAAQVESLVPTRECVMLITSRNHFYLPRIKAVNLGTFSPNEATQLLCEIAPRMGDEADAIARLCGYLPQALRLAAKAIAEGIDLSPARYRERLSDTKQQLNLLRDEDQSIEASITLSYNLLDPDMQLRWRSLGIFPDTFDTSAAAAIWELEPDQAQDFLSYFVKFSKLEWNETNHRYRLHDLMRTFASEKLDEAEREAAALRHARHYLEVIRRAGVLYRQGGESLMRGLALFDLERGNIQGGQSWAASRAGSSHEAAILCSDYPDRGTYILNLRQHPRESIRWREAALAATSQLADREAEGRHLGNLGLAYQVLGEYRRAIEYHEQYLTTARGIGNRRGEGQVLGNLGLAYHSLGEHRRAIEYHEHSLTIKRLTGERQGEANSLGNLGNAYGSLGEPGRAIEYYQQQLSITREIGDQQGTGNALWNMTFVLDGLGDRKKAVEHAKAALHIYEQIEDPNAARVRKQLDIWRNS